MIALIITPLVTSIIRKARIFADKRSIAAYGRSIDLAIAEYLMDTGSFPTSLAQLIVEYSYDYVVCETTQINPDSSVYLAGCKVKERDVTNYTYGSDKSPSYKTYNIGDEVNMYGAGCVKKDTVPSWLSNNNCSYWMSTPVENSATQFLYGSYYRKILNKTIIVDNEIGVRPVIVLDNSVLSSE